MLGWGRVKGVVAAVLVGFCGANTGVLPTFSMGSPPTR